MNPTKRVKTTEESLNLLKTEIHSWCGSHGLLMVTAENTFQHAPITLFPSNFPKTLYNDAVTLGKLFNILVDRVSRHPTFLRKTLSSAAKGDEFTQTLLEIYDKYGGSKSRQKLQLGIHRSDYMVDDHTNRLLQVELNTIASSFACLSARVSRLHRFLLMNNPDTHEALCSLNEKFQNVSTPKLLDQQLPINNADTKLPYALYTAHSIYQEKCAKNSASTLAIVFVVQEGEKNAVDQRHLEYELENNYHIPVFRLTLAQIYEHGRVMEPSGALLLYGEIYEVSVVYFRAGYVPKDYPSKIQWDAREKIESSLAIKCPSISYHLAGAKKIQQQLAAAGILEEFMENKEDCQKLRACFAGLWSLGAEDMDPAIISKAIQSPSEFVVKPQREGGGNNLYGAEVKKALTTMSSQELGAYILMERIFPPRENAFIFRNGEVKEGLTLQELGIYSTYLGDEEKSYLNEPAGHLLRTKFDGVDEGGVASGFGCLSSPWLV